MFNLKRTPKTAETSATESCLAFQHRVRSTTKRSISFIESFYHLGSSIALPPVNGSCSEYTKRLKDFLSSDLISCLAGIVPPGVEESEFFSFSASIASIPKSWPESCDCMNRGLEEEMIGRITQQKKELPSGYLDFVREKVLEIFPRGVREKDLLRHAERVTPPFSSTVEDGRADGGSYNFWHGNREEFLKGVENPVVSHESQFMIANSPGKPRPLVKTSATYLSLRPLHTFLYDTLSKTNWLLRGDIKGKKIMKAGFTTRQYYFSADFTAATDNLPIEVSEAIIDTLAYVSPLFSAPILAEARKSLRPSISFPSGKRIVPTTGQMMGNLLSFPLLCLQNWIAACWVDKKMGVHSPKLINGDDLVAQVDEQWVRTYRELAPSLGFSLNEKKTSFKYGFLNMNSTYFSGRRETFKEIPFIRAKSLGLKDPRDVGTVMRDILRPFERNRSTRTRRLCFELSIFFRDLIRASGKTLHSLDFRVRRLEDLQLCRIIRKREKERAGHDYRPIRKPRNPMGLDLVQVEDPFGVHDDKEVSQAIVSAHWEGGDFIRMKRENMSDVRKTLKKERMTRKRGCVSACWKRLVFEKKEKLCWIPSKLSDCYDLTHDNVRLEDGYIVTDECKVCERVREIMFQKKCEEYPYTSVSSFQYENKGN